MATIIGFIVAMFAILVGGILEGLHLDALFGPTALLIVVGGTIGATITSHTKEDFQQLGTALKQTISPPKVDFAHGVEQITTLAEKARKDGLLSLQADINTVEHPVLKRGLTMVVDGGDPEDVKQVLVSIVKLQEKTRLKAAAVCDTAGGYCPTLGILGTVMGLVHIMGNLSEPDSLGPAIAVAFLATLYGVFFANVIFLPLGSKIKLIVKKETLYGQMMVEGVVGIHSGDNPRFLSERLQIYAESQTKAKEGAN